MTDHKNYFKNLTMLLVLPSIFGLGVYVSQFESSPLINP